ncbi:MAG: hypothetical protein MUC94_09445 [bacterium]|nr:hypothetical protein [bacterium]
MLSPIFFGILTSIVIYIIIRSLFEEYDGSNILLYYVYAVILFFICVVIFIFRQPLGRVVYNIYFWNTILISTFIILILIAMNIFFRTRGKKRKKGLLEHQQ